MARLREALLDLGSAAVRNLLEPRQDDTVELLHHGLSIVAFSVCVLVFGRLMMASKEFSVVAILHPNKGQADTVLRMLRDVAEYVHAKEPGVLTYSINRSLRPNKDGTEEIIMIERYKDQAALKEHGTSQMFTAFQKKLAEQDLMRAPMVLKMVGEQGGFRSRL